MISYLIKATLRSGNCIRILIAIVMLGFDIEFLALLIHFRDPVDRIEVILIVSGVKIVHRQ